jgi:hypothetical protein
MITMIVTLFAPRGTALAAPRHICFATADLTEGVRVGPVFASRRTTPREIYRGATKDIIVRCEEADREIVADTLFTLPQVTSVRMP